MPEISHLTQKMDFAWLIAANHVVADGEPEIWRVGAKVLTVSAVALGVQQVGTRPALSDCKVWRRETNDCTKSLHYVSAVALGVKQVGTCPDLCDCKV